MLIRLNGCRWRERTKTWINDIRDARAIQLQFKVDGMCQKWYKDKFRQLKQIQNRKWCVYKNRISQMRRGVWLSKH